MRDTSHRICLKLSGSISFNFSIVDKYYTVLGDLCFLHVYCTGNIVFLGELYGKLNTVIF